MNNLNFGNNNVSNFEKYKIEFYDDGELKKVEYWDSLVKFSKFYGLKYYNVNSLLNYNNDKNIHKYSKELSKILKISENPKKKIDTNKFFNKNKPVKINYDNEYDAEDFYSNDHN